MPITASEPTLLSRVDGVAIDDIPVAAVILRKHGDSVANDTFFDWLGTDEAVRLTSRPPEDLVRQLKELHEGQEEKAKVWIDRPHGTRDSLVVASSKQLTGTEDILFVLMLDQPEESVQPKAASVLIEKHYLTLFEETAEPILIRREKKIEFVSDSLAQMVGYTTGQEIVDLNDPFAIVAPHSLERARDIVSRRKSGEPLRERYEIDLICKDGSFINVEAFGRTIQWKGSAAVQAVYRDITEQKRGLDKLERAAESLRSLIDNLPCGVLLHKHGDIIHANSELSRILGFESMEELTTQCSNIYVYFTDGEMLKNRSRRRVEGFTEPSHYETEVVDRTGVVRQVKISSSLLNWEDETVVLATLVDVTENYKASEKLARSEERFRDYASTAANWFWETDVDGRFSSLSSGFFDETQTPVTNIIGRSRDDIFSERDAHFHLNQSAYESAIENLNPFRDVKYSLIMDTGMRHSFSISGVPVMGERGDFVGYRGTTRDITEEINLQEALSFAATHDDLTGLINRRELMRLVNDAMAISNSPMFDIDEGGCDYLCYIDIDGLKIINDTVGHTIGDELLQQCAILLKQGLKDVDDVARLGGDEFGMLLRDTTEEEALGVVEDCLNRVSKYKFHREGRTFNVGFSAGLVAIDGRIRSTEEVFACADLSCYTAKERGKGRVHIYESTDSEIASRRFEMHTATEIESAIAADRLVIHAQPIVSLQTETHEPVHYELLVRMVTTAGDIIPPGAFIGAAERYNIAPKIDRFVFSKAMSDMSGHAIKNCDDLPHITLNLSGDTLGDGDFANFVISQFAKYPDVPPSHICFEVTETAAIRCLDVATTFISTMRGLGCSFALDDFGTGLSSFSYLKDLEVDMLKIDGVFISNIIDDRVNRAVVSSVCEVAKSLGRKVVAECVEDESTINMLMTLGVDYGQGYVWARPRPFEDILRELEIANIDSID